MARSLLPHLSLRRAAPALAGALLAGTLAAGSASAQTVVTWMHLETNEEYVVLWEEMVAEYEAEHPDVDIEMQFLANESFKAKLPTLLQSDARPDFFYSWGGGVLQAQAETGALMDLTDALNADGGAWRDSYNQASVEGLTFDGRTWAVPFKMGTLAFVYNRELFDQAGVDADAIETWDDFLAAVQQLKDAGITPIAAGGADKWPIHFYWSYLSMRNGGQEAMAAAKAGEGDGFLSEPFILAGEQLSALGELEPFQPGYLAATWPDAIGTFADGNTAMILAFEDTAQEQRNYAADSVGLAPDNIGRFPFPATEGGAGAVTDTLGGLNGWAVTADAPPETLDFLRFLTNEENERRMAEVGMIIPVARGAEDGITEPLLRAAADQLAASTWHQNYFDQDLGPAVGRVVNDISVEIASGNMDAEEGAQMIQDEFDLQM